MRFESSVNLYDGQTIGLKYSSRRLFESSVNLYDGQTIDSGKYARD